MDPAEVPEILRFVAWQRVPLALMVFALGWAALQVSGRFLDDLGERFVDRRLQLKKIKALSRFILYALLGLGTVSSVLSIDQQTMFAVAGSLGLAVGFAFKDVLASMMTGVLLLIDEPFQVGDRISFGGFYGEVTEIGLRSVRLATLDDNLVTIPNSQFLAAPVASANAGALDAMVVVPFYLAQDADFALARRIVYEATATSRFTYLGKPIVTELEDRFLGARWYVCELRVRAYVFDVRFEKAFASDVMERVKAAFRHYRIRTPDAEGAIAGGQAGDFADDDEDDA